MTITDKNAATEDTENNGDNSDTTQNGMINNDRNPANKPQDSESIFDDDADTEEDSEDSNQDGSPSVN